MHRGLCQTKAFSAPAKWIYWIGRWTGALKRCPLHFRRWSPGHRQSTPHTPYGQVGPGRLRAFGDDGLPAIGSPRRTPRTAKWVLVVYGLSETMVSRPSAVSSHTPYGRVEHNPSPSNQRRAVCSVISEAPWALSRLRVPALTFRVQWLCAPHTAPPRTAPPRTAPPRTAPPC